MYVFRLARKKFATLDGEGARLFGGRWNSVGRRVVYTSGNLSLAALESLVHYTPAVAPSDLVALTIELPATLAMQVVKLSSLSKSWADYSDLAECRAIGDAWLASGLTAVLRVPAAPVPEEWNYLINPEHPEAAGIAVHATRAFRFDPRLVD